MRREVERTLQARLEKFKFNKSRESLLIEFREMIWRCANRRLSFANVLM